MNIYLINHFIDFQSTGHRGEASPRLYQDKLDRQCIH